MKRREFMGILAGGFLFLFTGSRILFRKIKNGLIRPPGAVEEESFNYKCVRCGKCILVCPAKCLRPVSMEKGLMEWGTPCIEPRKAGCLMCFNCARVCPSSAVIDIKGSNPKIGTARIDVSRCLVWQHGKDCLVCLEYCPAGAIHTDDSGRPLVDPDTCIGCGICEANCPVDGISAIRVSNTGERRYRLREGRYR